MKKLLAQLNDKQREAVEFNKRPHMVVAGAGSGKTRVLTYKIAYNIKNGFEPSQILALTFTNKAAREMHERVRELIGRKADKLWMGTFHSIMARILRIEAERLGYKTNFAIYDREDSTALVNSIITVMNITLDGFTPNVIQHRISNMKNHMISPEEFRKHIAKTLFDRRLAEVYQEYNIRLKENNSMDFDDLLLKPIELFSSNKRALQTYTKQFKYILVDEYQDTNRAQYELIKLLSTSRTKVCVVGDDAQSIYGWRGADIKNMLDFEKDFPDSPVFRLEQNYRSTQTILKASDSVIKNNANQIEKTLWTDNEVGEPISLLRCLDEKDEAFQVAKLITQNISKRKIPFKDIAILYRTNSQSRALEEALRREKVPYKIVGGIEFYRRKEIKDLLAYLRVFSNQDDEESLLRIMNFPQRGIGNTSITKMIEFARRLNISLFTTMSRIFEVIEVKERIQKNVKQFKILLDKYIVLKEKLGITELMSALVDELEIMKMFKDEHTPEAKSRIQNIQELLSSFKEFERDNKKATIEEYLAGISLYSGIDSLIEGDNHITMMTVHSAKGLEFPLVFLTGCEEDIFPLNPRFDSDAHIEEERRLWYVAMTRAKLKITITYARSRYRFGEVAYQARSRFIEEIPEELTEELTVGTGRRSGRRRKSYYDDLYRKDYNPDFEEEQRSLRVGSRVVHELFGQGKILALMGNGDMQKVSISFEEHGVKNLLVKFANLKLI